VMQCDNIRSVVRSNQCPGVSCKFSIVVLLPSLELQERRIGEIDSRSMSHSAYSSFGIECSSKTEFNCDDSRVGGCCIKGSEGITALEMTEVERLMKFCCMIRAKEEREVPGDRSGDVGL
jgi:hypothetical protein